MAKKQGKVKAIPVKEVIEGMQVLAFTYDGWQPVLIKRIEKSSAYFDYKEKWGVELISSLKTLVVEYTPQIPEHRWQDAITTSIEHKGKCQLPLKYSQWQAALDNGEVDSDKVVEFKIKGCERDNDGDGNCGLHPEGCIIQIARIIPQKETWEDIFELSPHYPDDALEVAHWLKSNYHPPKRK